MTMSGDKKKRSKYFANKVDALRKVPAEMFEPIEFEEFMNWRVLNWEINPNYECLIREYIYDDDGTLVKVATGDYQRAGAAKTRLEKGLREGNREFVVANHDTVHHIQLQDIFDND